MGNLLDMLEPAAVESAMARELAGQEATEPGDAARLTPQLLAVYRIMRDGQWHTLSEMAESLPGVPQQSVSARVRDLRKARFGGHTIHRESIGGGLYRYRMAV